MIRQIFQKELMLERQMYQKNVNICHYWYFFDKGFQYEPYLYNDCLDLMQKVMKFNDVDIFSLKGSDYRIHLGYMGKDNVINIMKNFDLTEKVVYYKFFLNIKMDDKTTYYQINREKI